MDINALLTRSPPPSVFLTLKRLRALAVKGSPMPLELLDGAILEAGTVIGQLREISAELRPVFLERMSLIDAIRFQCSETGAHAGIEVSVLVSSDDCLHPRQRDLRHHQCAFGQGAGSMTITVILADDHAVLRQGLAPLLEMESDIALLAQAANGREAWEQIQAKLRDLKRQGYTTVTLSAREREVIRLIALGNSSKEIARILDISPATVGTYRNRLMDKLSLHTVADVVRYAVRAGMVD